MDSKVSLFADGVVGLKSLQFLLNNYREDLHSVVVYGDDSFVLKELDKNGFTKDAIFVFYKGREQELITFLKRSTPEFIILAWWPAIIKPDLIAVPRKAVINFHPSLLPHNRGKHYNFWTLVEETPFGVTLHQVNEGIDSGDILFQKPIAKTWEDTGESLYHKAQQAIVELFEESYPKLKAGAYLPVPQHLEEGSFHLAKELEEASTIDLDKTYVAKDLLNLLRARTFYPHPACRFTDPSGTYQVRIQIEKV